MPPKRRAAMNHRLVRGSKRPRDTTGTPREVNGVPITMDAAADGEFHYIPRNNNFVSIPSGILTSTVTDSNQTDHALPNPHNVNEPIREQLQQIWALLGQSGANKSGHSSSVSASNFPAHSFAECERGRVNPSSQSEAPGDASTNQMLPLGESLVFHAEAIDAHVKQQTREKVWRGEYVDLGTLLPVDGGVEEGESLTVTTDTTGRVIFKPVKAPAKKLTLGSWTSAFHVYMSIYLGKHFSLSIVQSLLSYMETIRSAALRFGQEAWMLYDQQFRHRMARDPLRRWDRIDGELWLKFMTPQSGRQQVGVYPPVSSLSLVC
ncbi:uncharacterized protein LOC124276383 [Haliotis rubra]|uniref:uncharacterized protein LOC124276383 n=1 Tax=Haliotis rubra TaxID=36100 RepID=UPI001EE52EBC|nr:uncharacterized protein LOC124276383 [Haliotis rubra]